MDPKLPQKFSHSWERHGTYGIHELHIPFTFLHDAWTFSPIEDVMLIPSSIMFVQLMNPSQCNWIACLEIDVPLMLRKVTSLTLTA